METVIKSALVDATIDEAEFREAMFRYLAIPTPNGMVLLADVVAAQKDKLLKGELDPEKKALSWQHEVNL